MCSTDGHLGRWLPLLISSTLGALQASASPHPGAGSIRVSAVLGPSGDLLELSRGRGVPFRHRRRAAPLLTHGEERGGKGIEHHKVVSQDASLLDNAWSSHPYPYIHQHEYHQHRGHHQQHRYQGHHGQNARQHVATRSAAPQHVAPQTASTKSVHRQEQRLAAEQARINRDSRLLRAENRSLKDEEQKFVAAVHKLQKDLKKESTSESASVGDAVALVFIGMLSMAILFFYLTQSGDASMRGSAWTVISDSTSLFCAILFYNILSDLMAMMSSKNDEQVRIGLAFTRLFVLFIGVEVSLVFLRRRPVPLAAAGLIGAHVLGFTAVDAFGEMQMAEPFRDKIGHCFAAVIIAVALFIAMCSIADVARQLLVHKKGGQDWDHDWDHQCEHTEDEAMAFGFGLLISQVIRFSILGYLPPLNGSSSKKKGGQILLLWTAAMGMSLLVLALAFLKAWIPRIYSKVQRALGLLQATAGMTMAWCLVFWLKWIYKTHGKGLMRYSSNMYVLFWMAMIWTTLGFAVICIIDKAERSSKRTIERGTAMRPASTTAADVSSCSRCLEH